MGDLFKKPFFQKVVLVVILSAAGTMIYASAATNIGSNISTDGTLSVAGVTTLDSALNVNDINISLASSTGAAIEITGTGTGIHFPSTVSSGFKGIEWGGSINGGFGIKLGGEVYDGTFIESYIGTNAKGVSLPWVGDNSVGFESLYIDRATGFLAQKGTNGAVGFKANWTATGATGTAFDIDLGNASDIGVDISGTVGTGIKTTRPISLQQAQAGEAGISFASNFTRNGIKFLNSSGNHSPWIYGDLGDNSIGVDIDWIAPASIGYLANYIEGIGFKAVKVSASGAVGFKADWTATGATGTAFDIDLGNASDIGIDISGTVGTGIKTTRPIDLETMSSKPTCDATVRGQIFYEEGGAGVADTFEICSKDVSDVYAWRALQ